MKGIVFNLLTELVRPLSVVFVDLDYFKKINDTHGHAAGDVVLGRVADALQRTCRNADLLARFGGEEFVIALPETDAENGLRFAERLRRVIEELCIQLGDGRELKVTVSAGLAAFPAHANSEDELVAAADAALYDAKRAGRNRIRLAGSNPPDS